MQNEPIDPEDMKLPNPLQDKDPKEQKDPKDKPKEPEETQGKPSSHITGFSRFADAKTGKEFHNTWDIQDKGDELHTSVGGADNDLAKFDIVSTEPEVIGHYREVRRQAALADYFRRRVLEAKPIPKPGKKKAKPRAAQRRGCPECEERGFVWVGDVKETCERCDGKGYVN